MRRRRSSSRIALRRVALLAAGLVLLAGLVGIAFAGSPTTLAAGTTIGTVDVGGRTSAEAERLLASKAAAVEKVPVTFTAAGKTFRLSASQLGVEAHWKAAVAAASSDGDGFGPVRGFRRLHTRLFGAQVAPPLTVYSAALGYELGKIAQAVDRPSVDARLVRHGLAIAVVPAQSGTALDRDAAGDAIVRALGSLDRGTAVALPVVAAPPRVTATELAGAARQARTALSAPVRLAYADTRWRLPRWRIAPMLDLPSEGDTGVSIGGRGAELYLRRLGHAVDRTPQDARFRVTAAGTIAITPSQPGLELDMAASLKSISAAAFSPTSRTARLVVREAEPKRSTEQARAMGISRVVSSYTTTYGGTPGRLHNVQLVAQLIDGTLIGPGETFSFNGTTGDRTAAKGFEEAPVIINGELQNGLGGGICQVSTTVFNAVFDAGLPITARTNHALYISHYPLGRDATVNYPDLDLKFRNDTGHWLLLRTFVGSGSLTVNLYGTPVGRRVESTTAPLTARGATPVKKVDDPALPKGKRVIESVGAPPRATSVERKVYDRDGKLLYDDTWRSSYVGEPTIVRVGTKPKPKQKKPKAGTPAAGDQPAPGSPPATVGAPAAAGPVSPASPR